MFRSFLFLIFATIVSVCYGQIEPDYRSFRELRSDSIMAILIYERDTLEHAYAKIESIRADFNTKADSLHITCYKATGRINEKIYHLKQKLDSINQLSPPPRKVIKRYQRSIEKLSGQHQRVKEQFTKKLNALKERTTSELRAIKLPPEHMERLHILTERIEQIKTPGLEFPQLSFPADNLPNINIPALPSSSNLSPSDLPQVPGAPGYSNMQDKIPTTSVPSNAEQIQSTIEAQVSKVDGLDELSKQSAVIEGHKSQLGELAELGDPAQAKQEMAVVGAKEAINHFEGKEDRLNAAMEKVAKYKQKFSSASSINDLPKRPPNPMKEKTFVERIIPGLYLQYQLKNQYLIDLNPYIGYKLSSRLTSGLGWNHRLAWNKKLKSWDPRARIFGPRGYIDLKLGRGFIAHIEGESMNTFIPSTIYGNPDSGTREWVWSCMTGIKKEYKIYKNLKGTALIQYNLFNRYYKAPYVDRLNSRVGFEYDIKMKK